MNALARWAVLLLLGPAACGQRAFRPEPVPVDKVECARCGMLVSREDQSAQWIAAGEEPRFYDDIGCLATDGWKPSGRSARFVRVGDGWSRAETAFYARPRGLSTAMGYDTAAFATRQEAASRDREGRARSWEELGAELRRDTDRRKPPPGRSTARR